MYFSSQSHSTFLTTIFFFIYGLSTPSQCTANFPGLTLSLSLILSCYFRIITNITPSPFSPPPPPSLNRFFFLFFHVSYSFSTFQTHSFFRFLSRVTPVRQTPLSPPPQILIPLAHRNLFRSPNTQDISHQEKRKELYSVSFFNTQKLCILFPFPYCFSI